MHRFTRPPFMRHLILSCAFALSALAAGCSSTEGWYENCESTSECVSTTECVQVAFEAGRDGAMCTATCELNADCPFGGACYELLGDPMEGQRVCYNRCRFDEDCGPGMVCAEAAMGEDVVDFICLPL